MARKIFDSVLPRKSKVPEQHIEVAGVDIDASASTFPPEFNFARPCTRKYLFGPRIDGEVCPNFDGRFPMTSYIRAARCL